MPEVVIEEFLLVLFSPSVDECNLERTINLFNILQL